MKQKLVQQHDSSKSLGPFHEWAYQAAELLRESEARFHHVMPRGEIVSRGLQKLSRQRVADWEHLRRLVPWVANQAVADWSRERRREESRRAPDDVDSLPHVNQSLPDCVMDRLDFLLGPDSPLDENEKDLLRVTLESPQRFLTRKGHPHQSALAHHLGVDQKTIFNRWHRIRNKVAALDRPSPEDREPLI